MSYPIIKIENLTKNFFNKANTIEVLDNISLEIMQGEIFGIIGMSGAGKSTLVRCINYLEKPTGGKIIFDGKDLSALSQKELNKVRQSMGMIFQQFNLLMQRNVIQNVCFPLEIAKVDKKSAKKRALELLEIVGLKDKAYAYPSQLSGGQKQRVAIARALATNPKVLLCDEATSALDPATTRSILKLLKEINQKMNITIVIITHEMSVVEEICQRVAIIEGGVVAEIGNVEDIFSRPKSQAAKRIVLPQRQYIENFDTKRCIRIIFDGRSSFEPVIANMILECKEIVNIIFADTKNIDGQAYGQIVIQIPEDEKSANKIITYLKDKGLVVEEVNDYV